MIADSFDLSGRRALVTGASRGIGLAIATGLRRHGADVALTSRKADSLEMTAAELRKSSGGKVVSLTCHQGCAERRTD